MQHKRKVAISILQNKIYNSLKPTPGSPSLLATAFLYLQQLDGALVPQVWPDDPAHGVSHVIVRHDIGSFVFERSFARLAVSAELLTFLATFVGPEHFGLGLCNGRRRDVGLCINRTL